MKESLRRVLKTKKEETEVHNLRFDYKKECI
jgi:hypothetical protein